MSKGVEFLMKNKITIINGFGKVKKNGKVEMIDITRQRNNLRKTYNYCDWWKI